jgi:hypothetical protein
VRGVPASLNRLGRAARPLAHGDGSSPYVINSGVLLITYTFPYDLINFSRFRSPLVLAVVLPLFRLLISITSSLPMAGNNSARLVTAEAAAPHHRLKC